MTPTPPRPLWAGRTPRPASASSSWRSTCAPPSRRSRRSSTELERDITLTPGGHRPARHAAAALLRGVRHPDAADREAVRPRADAHRRRSSRSSVGLFGSGPRGPTPSGWSRRATLTFAAIGVGNVLLPPLVKRYFPDRVGLHHRRSTSRRCRCSTFVPPLVAVPVAEAAGWRVSLGEWAIVAALALVPWIALRRCIRAGAGARGAARGGGVAACSGYAVRSPLAWALAVVFTISGFNAYAMFAWLPPILHDIAGHVSPAEAGALLSLFAAMGLPAGLVVPGHRGALRPRATARRRRDRRRSRSATSDCCSCRRPRPGSGWRSPAPGRSCSRSRSCSSTCARRTHSGAVALSGFVQSVGYLIVAVGPLAVGLLHESTGGWSLAADLPRELDRARGDRRLDRRASQLLRGRARRAELAARRAHDRTAVAAVPARRRWRATSVESRMLI